jgi:hypothetical protein
MHLDQSELDAFGPDFYDRQKDAVSCVHGALKKLKEAFS